MVPALFSEARVNLLVSVCSLSLRSLVCFREPVTCFSPTNSPPACTCSFHESNAARTTLMQRKVILQSTLSKRTLSKADTSPRRTANLVPAEFHLSLCNWTLSKADTSGSWTTDTFFFKILAQSDNRYVSWLNKIYQFVWAVLGSVGTTKTRRNRFGPSCDPVWRFGYQVTWTLSKADTSLKRTVALVPRGSWFWLAPGRYQ